MVNVVALTNPIDTNSLWSLQQQNLTKETGALNKVKQ